MEIGICKLCQNEKPLCDSHLLPQGLFKYCRVAGKEALHLTSEAVTVTAEEPTAPILCEVCEQRLNRDGENWLLPKLAARDGSFPLYDKLVQGKPDVEFENSAAYASPRIENFAFRKLTNFAIGVFWKASVHPWQEGRRRPRIDFGKYDEPFRLFLLRKGEFPKKACLTIGVLQPGKAVIGFNVPYLKSRRPVHSYFLYVPGMIFTLSVGNGITVEDRKACFFSNPLHPVLVKDFSRDILAHVNYNTRKAVASQEAIALAQKHRKP
jgi:hypothetical protein